MPRMVAAAGTAGPGDTAVITRYQFAREFSLTEGAAVSPDEPLPARDRERAIGLREHSQHPHPQHLRQAPYPGSILGSTARERAAAAIGGDQSLGPGSPDPGDAGSPARDRLWLHGHGIGPASIRLRINGHPGATLLSAFPAMVSEQQGARNRSHGPAGPVSAVQGAGQDRDARPGLHRGAPAHARTRITTTR
jgi:hypothetical protein